MTCGRILFYLCWDFVGFISNLRCHMLLIPPFSPPLLFLLCASDSLPVLLSGASMAVDAETHFHVLAVDDNLIDRKVIEKLLKSSCFHVTAVDSGSKALKFLGLQSDQEIENPFPQSPDHHVVEVNLIITDYCMPGMTGYDLLKRVKKSSSFRDIPVVIMSSENVPSRIDRCLAEGAEEFLLKPVRRFDISRFRPHILKAKHRGRQQAELHQKPQTLQEQERQEHELQQEEKQQQPSNKRKAADEGFVQENRRPRLSGLTVL